MTTVAQSRTYRPRRGEDQTAKVFLSRGQKVLFTVLAVAAVLYGAIAGPTALCQLIAALVTAFYVVFVGFKIVVAFAGGGFRFPHLNVTDRHDPALPTYSVLVPMRKESAAGFRLIMECIGRVMYPANKLQVLFIVDEDDVDTLRMVREHTLPANMELVEVPDVGPRTKPKACNYAMNMVTGERLLIWDFEDRPEPVQLLKAVAALNYYAVRDRSVACVQGMLQFWNPRGGKANAFYWAEYIVHFRWMLPGLARLGLIPPLGGTSNHFLTAALWGVDRQYGSLEFWRDDEMITIPNVWDSYNVTEDADLAARLKRCGFKIKMVDTVTFEEAPRTLKKAKDQKSRWLKGFIQTFLVQSRRPVRSMREMGVAQYLAYNLFIGGTPLSFLINPIVWVTTLLYIVSRIAGWEGITLFIESLFPSAVYYPAMFIAIVGNGVLLYQMLLTPLRQQEHESFVHMPVGVQQQQFGNAWRLAIGAGLWWIFTTVPAYKGTAELFNKNTRFYWNKTDHGEDMHREGAILGTGDRRPALTGGSGAHRLADRQTGEQRRVR